MLPNTRQVKILFLNAVFLTAGTVLAGEIPVGPGQAVNAHNAVRARLNSGGYYLGQPVPNPPLPNLFWDADLAASAREYAGECVFQHSSNRINTGENLYASTAPDADIDDAVEAWAGEESFYTFDTNECLPGEQCGHYTQVVWHSTLTVGCAAAGCSPLLNRPDGTSLLPSAVFIVCQYGPAGNLLGAQPYETDGGDDSLWGLYTAETRELELPYLLIRTPDNVVVPFSLTLKLSSLAPAVNFELDPYDAHPAEYNSERKHVAVLDVNRLRLYIPHLDVSAGGNLLRNHSAVIDYVPGTVDPLEFNLKYIQ
jgi:hypothetical protein